MDALGSYLFAEVLRSLGEGNLVKFCAYLAIFLILWLEMRGLKKAVKKLSDAISQSFADGEKRFDNMDIVIQTIEKNQKDFEHRLTLLEQPQGGLHG